jgi:hypothetical protein
MSIFPSANGNVNLSEMFLDDFLRTAGAFELHQFREMPAVKQRRICRIFAPAESSNPKKRVTVKCYNGVFDAPGDLHKTLRCREKRWCAILGSNQ